MRISLLEDLFCEVRLKVEVILHYIGPCVLEYLDLAEGHDLAHEVSGMVLY